MTAEALLEDIAEVAEAALARYGISGSPPPVLVNVSENATYRVEDSERGARYALRVHRDGYHSLNAIASELAWMRALRNDGAAITPRPVAASDGTLIQSIAHPRLPGPRHVVMFDWESGIEPSETDDLGSGFAILGETAARMHRHARAWRRPAGFERFTWDFATSLGAEPHWGSWRDGIAVDPRTCFLFERTVALIERRLERFGKTADRFGLVHADMRLANLLIDGATVKILDFDDCGFSWNLYDAATAVSFFEHDPHVDELLAKWCEGYRGVAVLADIEEAEIPTFVMLRRLLLVAWIGSHTETDLARSLGADYTAATAPLCERYLTRFG